MEGLDLVVKDDELDYAVYNSKYIRDNLDEIIWHSDFSHMKFKHLPFLGPDSNRSYTLYNIFSLSAPSIHFYYIYKDLIKVIKERNKGVEEPLWAHSWINYHNEDELLDWHDHVGWKFHGYISIQPQKTRTVFRNPDYEIVNEPGNIYVGPGLREHRVVADEPFHGKRITLGYDVTNEGNSIDLDSAISFIPIL